MKEGGKGEGDDDDGYNFWFVSLNRAGGLC